MKDKKYIFTLTMSYMDIKHSDYSHTHTLCLFMMNRHGVSKIVKLTLIDWPT